MAPTHARGSAETSNEDFAALLAKGNELLVAGNVAEAKEHLERASQIQPKNEKGRNLLGLAYFKLGLFDQAGQVYERLVRDNPVDPTLRVNLGLVYLKANDSARAVREFKAAVDLAPEHKKAHNYLGLALAQGGDFQRAQEHFVLAGSEAMAEKMRQAAAGKPVSVPSPNPIRAAPETSPAPPATPAAARPSTAPEFGTPALKGAALGGGGASTVTGTPPEVEIQEQASFEDMPGQVEEISVYETQGQGIELLDAAPTHEDVAQSQQMVEEAFMRAEGGDPGFAAYASVEDGSQASHEAAATASQLVENDWGAQFGFDANAAPAPSNPFQPPAHMLTELGFTPQGTLAPSAAPAQDDEIRFAFDEGPSAPPIDAPMPVEMPPQAREPDVALEVAAAGEPAETIVLSESMMDASAAPPSGLSGAPGLGGGATQLWQGEPNAPFAVTSEAVSINVQGSMFVRCDGLLAVRGNLQFTPEVRHYRGRPTGEPFGEGSLQLQRAQGSGSLVIEPGRRHFSVLTLGEQSAYFREEAVFGFQEVLTFENGRIQSDFAPDIALVHLSGEGEVLLQPAGALKTLEVQQDSPVTLPLSHWVGWYGNVVPRVVLLPFPVKGKQAVGVELSGEGFALLVTHSG